MSKKLSAAKISEAGVRSLDASSSAATRGNSVTYRRKGEGWYVISGVLPNGVEFYRMLAVQAQNCASFEITYPHRENAKYDRWVERIARSFVPFLQGNNDRAAPQ